MKTLHRETKRWYFLVLMAMVSVAFIGCGDSVTNPALDPGDELVSDPLDGVLNSTSGSTPVDASARMDRLAEALGLSPDQKEALRAAYGAFHEGLHSLKEQVRSGEMTREAAKESAMALRDAFEAELQVILTPEQYEQLQDMRASRDDHRPGPRPGHGDLWAEWMDAIGASADQIADIEAAKTVMHDGMIALRGQVRSGDLTLQEAREAAAALRDAFDASLQAILTAEQYEALLALRPDRQHHHRR